VSLGEGVASNKGWGCLTLKCGATGSSLVRTRRLDLGLDFDFDGGDDDNDNDDDAGSG